MDRDTRNILNLKQPNLFSHGEVSTDGMSDGQITISKGYNQQTTLSLKKDGRIYKTNMSSNGNQYVDKDLKVNGNINLSNKLIIKNYPAFGVYQSSSADAQQIENDAYETIVFDTKLYDNGDDFSTSDYSFTAPMNGIYHFNARILWDGNESAGDGDWAAEDYNQISLVKNDRTSVPDSADIVALERDTIQGAVTDVYLSNRIVSDLRLDAGDYISVAVKHVTAAGHSQYTYAPTSPYMWTSLTGHLVCAL
jgi:hypothetical protein